MNAALQHRNPRTSGLSRIGMLCALLGCLGVFGPVGVRAAGTVTVSTTAALLEALNGGGLVRLAITETLTVDLPLIIASDTILEGAGVGGRTITLSGAGSFRVFRVLPGVRFEVRGITIRDGISTQGGAILNQGTLLADSVIFTACEAAGADGVAGIVGGIEYGFGQPGTPGSSGVPAAGGAVYNLGDAKFTGCTFLVNEARGGIGGAGGNGGAGTTHAGEGGAGGFGAAGFGGAIANLGQLTITNCLFSGNVARAGEGGAGGTGGGVLGSGQGGEGADAGGGAIHNTGFLFLTASSFTTNLVIASASADAGAPGVNIGNDGADGGTGFGGAISTWSTSLVANVTFYTNIVSGGKGGNGAAGTWIVGAGGDGGDALGGALHVRGTLAMTNVTIAWNGASGGVQGTGAGGLSGPDGLVGVPRGGAIGADSGAIVTAINSIFATAAGTNLVNLHGPFRDDGFNLFNDVGPASVGTGSRINLDPQLSNFAVWTLGTPGLLPVAGSPAIDAAYLPAAPPVDQRGIARFTGRGAEIGALEAPHNAFIVGGNVLDGTNGIPGVEVRMGTNRVVTSASGRFDFPPVPSGTYSVELPNDGIGFTPRIQQIFVSADLPRLIFRVAPITLAIARDAAPGWFVLHGVGVPGVTYALEGGPDLFTWQPLATGTADAQGRLTFEQAPGFGTERYYRLRAE